MKILATILAPAFALAACQPVQDNPEEGDATPAIDSTASAPDNAAAADKIDVPQSLVGEYRVAGIDGKELDIPVGFALSITDTEIHDGQGCGARHWRYAYEKGVLETKRFLMHEDNAANCPIFRRTREWIALGEAIDAATGAERTRANGIELSGNGRSVTLFSQ
ncbi:hypothetical protein [Pseudoblastomonas halimionae]|uniref:META domain-containing protein n=1 Tax=Alteriqipengyuania halimionae TaxID=1926630 RepID=A0A6I4UA81_9SPHN|nr:hypothetical protein [Alteriqipengyuania halimionae]MXP11171.1 hypothetical protein [Alteriqipengyuania halimionae]